MGTNGGTLQRTDRDTDKTEAQPLWSTALLCRLNNVACCGTLCLFHSRDQQVFSYVIFTATWIKTTAHVPEDPHCHQEECQEDPGCWWERKKRKSILIIIKMCWSNIWLVLPLSQSIIPLALTGGPSAPTGPASPARPSEPWWKNREHQQCSCKPCRASPTYITFLCSRWNATKKSYHLLVWFYCNCLMH